MVIDIKSSVGNPPAMHDIDTLTIRVPYKSSLSSAKTENLYTTLPVVQSS
jgi:hypothetical protein